MYWVVLSCFSLFDYWTWFILSWLPFYAYVRLIVLSYLVLPQTQGAKLLYQDYIHPFLSHHEHEIEKFITSVHERSVAAGFGYLKQLVDFVKERVLGVPHHSPVPSRQPSGTYAQNLLSRFNLPTAREGLAAPAGDFYGLLSSAVGGLASSPGASREAQVDSLSRSGTLIPRNLSSTSDKMSYLSTQRERLKVLLTALDKQASDLSTEAAIERDIDKRLAGEQLGQGATEGLRSNTPFEEIIGDGPGQEQGKTKTAGSWMPWGWSSGGAKTSGVDIGKGT